MIHSIIPPKTINLVVQCASFLYFMQTEIRLARHSDWSKYLSPYCLSSTGSGLKKFNVCDLWLSTLFVDKQQHC